MPNKIIGISLSLLFSISYLSVAGAAEIFNGREVKAVRPAGCADGKVLTMEEAILSIFFMAER